MSTVMRPSGPLPSRVYWTRRLALLTVVLLATVVLWWLVSGAGDADETTAPDVVPTTTDRITTSEPTKKPTRSTPTTQALPTTPAPRPAPKPEPEQRSPRPTATLAQPTDSCDATAVDMTIDVADVKAGRSNTATFLLTSPDAEACTLAVTPTSLVVNVTSGTDTVWSSDDCPDELLAKQVVVRSDPPSSYQFTWRGNRSSEGCQIDGASVEPGGYWVEAAFIGGEPHKAYFDIT